MKKSKFTMIELMFVIAIVVVLMGISWVAGTKVLRAQVKAKTKAEITLISAAVTQYKTRWGSYPNEAAYRDVDFTDYLSKVKPNSGWTGARPMYIDFKAADIIRAYRISNNLGLQVEGDNGNTKVTYSPNDSGDYLLDPYENPYLYFTDDDANGNPIRFTIVSIGADGKMDWPSDSTNTASGYDSSTDDNKDNVSSDDL